MLVVANTLADPRGWRGGSHSASEHTYVLQSDIWGLIDETTSFSKMTSNQRILCFKAFSPAHKTCWKQLPMQDMLPCAFPFSHNNRCYCIEVLKISVQNLFQYTSHFHKAVLHFGDMELTCKCGWLCRRCRGRVQTSEILHTYICCWTFHDVFFLFKFF